MAAVVPPQVGQTKLLTDLLLGLAVHTHGIGVICPNDSTERMKLKVPLQNPPKYDRSIYLNWESPKLCSQPAIKSSVTKDDEAAAMAAMFQASAANWEETQEKMSQLVSPPNGFHCPCSSLISSNERIFSPSIFFCGLL